MEKPLAKSTSKPVPRNLKPRAAVVVSPLSVTQLNCDAVLGINAPRYLEAGRKYSAELRPARVGKLIVTTIDRWEALLAKLAGEGVDEPFPEPAAEPAALTSDAVLAKLGLRRRAS